MEKLCPQCGEVKPATEFHKNKGRVDGLNGWCKQCMSSKFKNRYQEKREEILVHQHEYALAHPEARRETIAKYYASNHDAILKKNRLYILVNADRIRKRKYARYVANPELFREWKRQWRKANPEKAREEGRRRRQKKAASICDLTSKQWEAIKAAHNYQCVYCGISSRKLTQDHAIPLAKGGNHTASNVLPACQSCNSSKGTSEKPWHVRVHR